MLELALTRSCSDLHSWFDAMCTLIPSFNPDTVQRVLLKIELPKLDGHNSVGARSRRSGEPGRRMREPSTK